jgi:hypothetical protein
VNREEVAARRRRQEAIDSLEFEREREAALVQRLEPMIRDADAWRADERAFAVMSEEDKATLREIGFVLPRPPEESRARIEAQIAELQAQIEDSRRRQRAFAAYASALEP